MLTISLSSVIELGLIYSLVSLGVFLSFRVINFPDLTVDGSFPLGAGVAAILITQGFPPLFAVAAAFFAGMMAGYVTAFLHVYLNMMGLLASILVMSALYSVNIRVMGRPNIALINLPTVFGPYSALWVLALTILGVYFLLSRFMLSEHGLALRALGMNPKLSRTYGVKSGKMILLALALSNGLVALAGALFAELEGFADVSLGTGTIIIGLASVLLGEALLRSRHITINLLACIIGAILYRAVIALALNTEEIGLQPSDLNLITAILVTLAVAIPYFYRKGKSHD